MKLKQIKKFSEFISKNYKKGSFESLEQQEQTLRHIQLEIQRMKLKQI